MREDPIDLSKVSFGQSLFNVKACCHITARKRLQHWNKQVHECSCAFAVVGEGIVYEDTEFIW